MVAMADRSHSTQSPTHVAYHHRRTMTQTISQATNSQRWRSPLSLRSQVGYSFCSSRTGLGDQQFKAPPSAQPFLTSRVLPSSKVMSSQIIQPFLNRLHFARLPFGELFTQQIATVPLEARWLPCKASGINMLIFPESNPSNEWIPSQTSWNDCTTEQPHQREQNNVCDNKECGPTRTVNLITGNDLTQCQNQEMDPVALESTFVELCVEEDSDLSDCEPSHSEYESDDDECIEFSEESLTVPEAQTPNSTKYVTLVSSESGYFECAPGCDQLEETEDLENCWSDSDSDGDIEFCSEVWDSFEIQALSPMVKCTRTQAKTCSKTDIDSKSTAGKVDTNTFQTQLSEAFELPNKDESKDQPNNITVPNPKKRVSFKPDSELVEVHTIVAWEYAYRAARKGPWEQFARDRCHFRRRIDSVSAVLEPCLSNKLSRMSSLRES